MGKGSLKPNNNKKKSSSSNKKQNKLSEYTTFSHKHNKHIEFLFSALRVCVCAGLLAVVLRPSACHERVFVCALPVLPARHHTDLRVASPAHVTFRHDLAHVYPACRTSLLSPQRLAASPNLLLCLHIICPKNRRNATRHAQFIISPSKFEQFQVAKSDGAAATSPACQPARSLPAEVAGSASASAAFDS